jgi:hypothetical protein
MNTAPVLASAGNTTCEKCTRPTRDGHRLCGRCYGATREIAARASGYEAGYRDGYAAGRRDATEGKREVRSLTPMNHPPVDTGTLT